MKILLLDNYDSFTYNLLHIVKELGYKDVEVHRNDKIEISEIEKFDKIILSPGPGIPSEAGILLDVICRYAPSKSILGVCLGHQAIAEAFGAKLINLESVFHGVQSQISVDNSDYIFSGLDSKQSVGRYHSWVVEPSSLTSSLEVIATSEERQIMALRHREYDVRGIQFHPESILTPQGKMMIENFLKR